MSPPTARAAHSIPASVTGGTGVPSGSRPTVAGHPVGARQRRRRARGRHRRRRTHPDRQAQRVAGRRASGRPVGAGAQGAGASAPASTPSWSTTCVWGCVNQVGDQAAQIGRYAVLAAGWPESVPGVTVNRACGSSQQLVRLRGGHGAGRAVRPGGGRRGRVDDAGAAGQRPRRRQPVRPARARALPGRSGERRVPGGTSTRASAPSASPSGWGLSRRTLDEFASRSHELAAAAHRPGALRRPARPRPRRARPRRRRGAAPRHHAETLATAEALLPRGRRDPRRQRVADLRRRLGRAPRRRRNARPSSASRRSPAYHTGAVSGADPLEMLTGPIPATAKVLKRSGLSHRRHRRVRGQRGLRVGAAGLARRDRRRPVERGSTRWAARSRWATRSARRAPILMTRWCTTCATTASATACRPCARAAARPTRRSWSCSRWRDRRRGGTLPGTGPGTRALTGGARSRPGELPRMSSARSQAREARCSHE